jgi:hypothetical protein
VLAVAYVGRLRAGQCMASSRPVNRTVHIWVAVLHLHSPVYSTGRLPLWQATTRHVATKP